MNSKNIEKACGAFFILPKFLIEDECSDLSLMASVLYALMLDRFKLSEKNGWTDEDGRTFIYFSQEEIGKNLKCCTGKAAKVAAELEEKGFISKKKTGQGHPTRYYLSDEKLYCGEGIKTLLPSESRPASDAGQDSAQSVPNNTEKNNTELSNNYTFIGEEDVKENIDYDLLIGTEDKREVDSVVSIICDAVNTSNSQVHIGRECYPRQTVRERLLSLNDEHIRYVLELLQNSRSEIRSIRPYTLKLLFYAPSTMELYYTAKVSSDMAKEKADYSP